MPYRASQNRNLVWVLFLILSATPATAHKVQVAEDVGGTLHIEPNDTPRAGEPALTWFALTRKGGQAVSLQQCNCKLSVYSEPSAAGSPPILTPLLKAVSVEKYQGIPGAEVQFPEPGAYRLQLSGTPTVQGNFKPFELKFEVTVAGGKPIPTASPQVTQSPTVSKPQTRQTGFSWQLPVIASVLGVGILWAVRRSRK